jgi:hypothetical protein
MPIQRVPRLLMLVEQLLQSTPHSHSDHKPLTEGLKRLSKVATMMNLAVHERESRLNVWRVAQQIANLPFNLVESHR